MLDTMDASPSLEIRFHDHRHGSECVARVGDDEAGFPLEMSAGSKKPLLGTILCSTCPVQVDSQQKTHKHACRAA